MIFFVALVATLSSAFGLAQSVAFAVGFEDVDAVGEAVEEGAGEAFVAEDFGPL